MMNDENMPKVMPEWPITPAQWQMIRDNRRGVLVSRLQAERWHLKPGDTFTVIAPPYTRRPTAPTTGPSRSLR